MASIWFYWLEHGGQRYELSGTVLLGRSEQCQIVLDDALVSRQHARIVADEALRIEDAGSSNGVFVNGTRVQSTELQEGDTIGIGHQRLVVRREERRARRRARTMAETMQGARLEDLRVSDLQAGDATDSMTSTMQREPLELIAPVVDKALALGRGEEAERLLQNHLERHLERARRDRKATPHTERAAVYAVRLAEVTRAPRWIDYCFELYAELALPLPAAAIEQLYSTLRAVAGVSRSRYRAYVEVLESKANELGPRDRFLVQRIGGLAHLIR